MSDIRSVALTKLTESFPAAPASGAPRPLGSGFGELLSKFVQETNQAQHQAGQAVENLITGRTEHLHETVVSMSQAEMSFRYLMEVRSRLLQAYQEIQRMQL